MTPKITEVEEFKLVQYPAMTYIERTDREPICVDEGGIHLGIRTPGVAVPFQTRRYGMQHKHFGLGQYDDGTPFAYGKGAIVSNTKSEHEYLSAAQIGSVVSYKGKTYRIKETPNQNIKLEPVE